jgi:hypothetical protein
MGQAASKRLAKTAEAVVKKVAETKPPPASSSVAPRAATNSATKTQSAANPGSFLRGEGLGQQDIRDIGQELFLQNLHKVDAKDGPPEMPADLLKFIQDVGPVKQTVDNEFTASRLLEKENEGELIKPESTRRQVRERTRMPLMGEDQDFTTTRNTNFSTSHDDKKAEDFGTSNLELYDLLSRKSNSGGNPDTVVVDFFKTITPGEDGLLTDSEKKLYHQRIKETLEAIELPVLVTDSDGNFLGLYPDDVPGPEVKSVRAIPKTKLKLVLEDIVDRHRSGDTLARDRLQRQRRERKEQLL